MHQPPVSSSPGFHPEHLAEAPAGFMHVPVALGLAGAIPFVALAAPLAPALGGYVPAGLFPVERRAEAQAKYGAAIVSFLGGMHWGFAGAGFAEAGAAAGAGASAAAKEALLLAGPARFAWSVVPSLLAWPALMCATPYALVAVAASLAATLAADAGFAAKKLMPRWLMPLRFGLTGVAVLGLLASVPAALEAHDNEREREAHAARLRADAPATRQALRARDRALADLQKKPTPRRPSRARSRRGSRRAKPSSRERRLSCAWPRARGTRRRRWRRRGARRSRRRRRRRRPRRSGSRRKRRARARIKKRSSRNPTASTRRL